MAHIPPTDAPPAEVHAVARVRALQPFEAMDAPHAEVVRWADVLAALGGVDLSAADTTVGSTLDGETVILGGHAVEIRKSADGPATCKVWRHGTLIFDGVDRSALLTRDETPR